MNTSSLTVHSQVEAATYCYKLLAALLSMEYFLLLVVHVLMNPMFSSGECMDQCACADSIPTAELLSVTASYEESGRQLVCPGEQITFTCTGKNISLMKWIVDGDEIPKYTPLDCVTGSNRTLQEFVARLTCTCSVEEDPGKGNITSTLTALVLPQMNGTKVACSIQTANGTVKTAIEIVVEGHLHPPDSVEYEVISGTTTESFVTLKWNSSSDDVMYTVTASGALANVSVQTYQTSVSFLLPHESNYTITVTAMGECTANSTTIFLEFPECMQRSTQILVEGHILYPPDSVEYEIISGTATESFVTLKWNSSSDDVMYTVTASGALANVSVQTDQTSVSFLLPHESNYTITVTAMGECTANSTVIILEIPAEDNKGMQPSIRVPLLSSTSVLGVLLVLETVIILIQCCWKAKQNKCRETETNQKMELEITHDQGLQQAAVDSRTEHPDGGATEHANLSQVQDSRGGVERIYEEILSFGQTQGSGKSNVSLEIETSHNSAYGQPRR